MGTGRWSFGGETEVVVAVSGTMQANNGDALRAAALAGLGMIYQPTFLVGADVRSGALVALSLDHPPALAGYIQAVFRPDRRLPLKSRVMIEFLAGEFGEEPLWDRG